MLPTWTHSIHHDGSTRYVTLSQKTIGAIATIRLRAGLDAPVKGVFIRTEPDGERRMTPMRRVAEDAVCCWWEGRLCLEMPKTHYRFLLVTDEGGWSLTAGGVVRYTPTDATDFCLLVDYDAPDWVRKAVFYQIFPDRFADGDPTNNVRDGEYLVEGKSVVARPWGALPQRATGQAEFFGGDLQGIIDHLPYLEELGVSGLYLNPIFTAPSNHKYDAATYREVDPHFGGNEALIALRRALDERGMRLMIDIVPNHCGATHEWFLAAQNDLSAPSADFFTFHAHPHDYEAWLGVKSLPKLDYRSKLLRKQMYAGPEAIMRHWLRPPYRIDGWRVDVANMLGRQGGSQLGHKIHRGIRRAVKAENPNAYLLGENFFDGTSHLQGDELDATMNYRGFMLPLLQWLTVFNDPHPWNKEWRDSTLLPTEALAAQWRTFIAAIPWQIVQQQFNLLGSHDTPRIWTVLGENEALAKIATTLLFTFPGVPSIYYGDEIGLPGFGDPDCRRCMPWDDSHWNHSLREHYRSLIQLRRRSSALQEGGFQLLHTSYHTLAFLRESENERLLIIARRAQDNLQALSVRHGALPDGLHLREFFTQSEQTITNGHLSLNSLPPTGIQLWHIDSATAILT